MISAATGKAVATHKMNAADTAVADRRARVVMPLVFGAVKSGLLIEKSVVRSADTAACPKCDWTQVIAIGCGLFF